MVQTEYGWSVGYIGGQIKMGWNEMVGGIWSQMTKEVLCQVLSSLDFVLLAII